MRRSSDPSGSISAATILPEGSWRGGWSRGKAWVWAGWRARASRGPSVLNEAKQRSVRVDQRGNDLARRLLARRMEPWETVAFGGDARCDQLRGEAIQVVRPAQ